MKSNKLRMAVRATATLAVLGAASQAMAVELQTGDYKSSLYGYARLNASYDINEDVSSSTRSFDYSAINVGAAEDNEVTGFFGADAVQSRIGFKTMSPEGVTFNIEGDFRPGTLRLRHAYGSYHGVLMGQTWSNFTSFVGNTSTLDFDSLPGAAGYQSRTAQARYTTGPLSFSVEQPQNSVSGTSTRKDSMPAFTARIEDSAGGLSYSAAVLAQQVSYDDSASAGNNDSSLGFATFVAANMAVTDMITIQGTLSYTDGANSYLYRSGAPSAYVDPANGNIETISGYGGSVGTGINLGGGRSVNIGYGMVTVDLDDAVNSGAVLGTKTDTTQAVMANYKWTPIKNVMMGVEYQYGKREVQNGDSGDASRILFASQYNF